VALALTFTAAEDAPPPRVCVRFFYSFWAGVGPAVQHTSSALELFASLLVTHVPFIIRRTIMDPKQKSHQLVLPLMPPKKKRTGARSGSAVVPDRHAGAAESREEGMQVTELKYSRDEI
jgi:hypothetical protein